MNYYRELDRNKIQFDFLLTDQSKCNFEDEILSLGGKVYRVPPLVMRHPMAYIRGVKKFFISHPEYEIVHSHTSSKSTIPLAIAKSCDIPIRISHSHNSMSEKGLNGLIRDALKPFLRITANFYFSCGEQASGWLYGKKMSQSGKVEIIRNVIDANKFKYNKESRDRVRKQLGINDDTFVVGNVARFCKEKNHVFAIEILNNLLQVNPNTVLLLVGDGPERASITEYAEKLNVADKVKMVGVVPNVYDYVQAMDVFILPSFYEGLPLSIIEAQVSGLPCFTTKGSVSTECSVTDLVKYLPLDAGPKFWADEIYKARELERIDRFEEIKAAGYESVSTATKLQDLYIQLLNSSKK
ncbi:glycosyltransferase family 1 protein [bacterium]|nr:glycosyltransferase family 1 protein [bacterium]